MIGHEPLILMRKQGYVCQTVFVDEVGGDLKWHHYSGTFPNVQIAKEENLKTLDLRWAYGLTIQASADGITRSTELYKAFQSAKAKRTICCATEISLNKWGRYESEVIEIMDSDEALTWRK